MELKLNETAVQALKYGLIGILNLLVGTGVYSFCLYILKIDYRISNAASYFVGIIHRYLWNRFWTFKSKKNATSELFWFVMVFLFSFAVQNLLLTGLVEKLNFSKFYAYLITMSVYPLISFFGNKYITFRKTV